MRFLISLTITYKHVIKTCKTTASLWLMIENIFWLIWNKKKIQIHSIIILRHLTELHDTTFNFIHKYSINKEILILSRSEYPRKRRKLETRKKDEKLSKSSITAGIGDYMAKNNNKNQRRVRRVKAICRQNTLSKITDEFSRMSSLWAMKIKFKTVFNRSWLYRWWWREFPLFFISCVILPRGRRPIDERMEWSEQIKAKKSDSAERFHFVQ